MKKAAPWSIDGIDPDIREAAREAARRQGLSLSDWLNDIIIAQASDLDIEVDDMDADDRLEAVAARLHQLDRGDERAAQRARPRSAPPAAYASAAYDDDVPLRGPARASAPLEPFEDPRRMKRQARMPDRSRGHMRVEDAEALLDSAVEAFELSAAKNQRQTAQSVEAVTRLIKSQKRQRDDSLEALSDISKRLSDIETQMTRNADEGLRGKAGHGKELEALPVVAKRLADIESHLAKRTPDEAYNPIKSVLARLESRLESFSQKPAPPARDEVGLKRLENKLDALLRSSALSPADEPVQRPAGKPAWRDSLESAVAEIGNHQRHLNGGSLNSRAARAEQPVFSMRSERGSAATARAIEPQPIQREVDLHPLQRDIAALGAKLEEMRLQDLAKDLTRMRTEIGTMSAGLAELAPRDSLTSIEAAIRNLTTRIETSREEGMRETLLKPLTELANDLRHSLDAIGPLPSIDGLEREIKTIGDKIECIGTAPHDPAALARIQAQTQDIHDLLTSAAARPLPFEQIEKNVAALAEEIARQKAQEQNAFGLFQSKLMDVIDSRNSEWDAQASSRTRDLDRDGRPLQASAGTALPDQDFLPRLQQTQIESLTKIEDRLDDLAIKFEKAITARPEPGSQIDAASLETVVRALADKFAVAQDQRAGNDAFEALQSQIAELAQRLERSDTGYSALSALQHSVSDLFTHLDETRDAATEAAQSSARSAALEAVREVMKQPGLIAAGPDGSVITREIANLRAVQDEGDRRTHSTLNAVHETLEKIVDRLAMLEEEISEVQETSVSEQRLAELNAVFERYQDGALATPSAPLPKMPAAKQMPRDVLVGDDAPRVRPVTNPSADFLIEPGTLFPKSKEALASKDAGAAISNRLAATSSEPERGRSDFIAAARRAAQAAQAEHPEVARPRIPMGETKPSKPGLIAHTRDFVVNHKRQLTLSVAALFLVVGAYAVVKTMGHAIDMSLNQDAAVRMLADKLPERKAVPRAPANDVASNPAPQTPADQDTARAPSAPPAQQAAPSGNLPMLAMPGGGGQPQKAIAGSDPIVTGSINSPKPATAPLPESPAAAQALRDQAEAGNAIAQYDLATRYAEGQLLPRDFKMAAEWYEKAAIRGLAPAQYRVGSLYEKGIGVGRDLSRAKSWYEKAAQQGHVRAMHNLAVLIAEGGDGKPDYAVAAGWFRKAASFGIRDSAYNLAILYARGLGVQQDLVQSYTWFGIAAAQGDDDAAKKREDVGAKLDAKALAQAKAAVAAFNLQEPDRTVNEVQSPPGGWEAANPAPSQTLPKIAKPKISRL